MLLQNLFLLGIPSVNKANRRCSPGEGALPPGRKLHSNLSDVTTLNTTLGYFIFSLIVT